MSGSASITGSGLLRVEEAADLLGLKPSTVRSWLLKRKLPFVRVSARAIRLRRSDLEKFLQNQFVPAREPAETREPMPAGSRQ